MLHAVIFLLTVFFYDSHQQCFSSNDNAPNLNSDKHNSWINSRNNFGVSLFQALNKESNQENVIFSPSSVHDVLLLAYFGAAYETERLLAKVLKKPTGVGKSEVWRFYHNERQINSQRGNGSNPLKVGNKIFISNQLRLRPCIQEYLRSEIELIDYQTNVELAKNYINYWVSYVTEGEIKDAIKTLSPQSSATLVNAVLFKGKWLREFNTNNTQMLPFRVNLKYSKPTWMMVKTDDFSFGYLEDIKARLLRLPYEGDKHAMIILLPDKDLDTMIESLNSNIIGVITNTYILKSSGNIKVIIPKIEQRNDLALTPILEKLGIGNTLTSNAVFSRFTGRKEVFFSELNQQAMIKVDEQGTKAAAGTVGQTPYSAVIDAPEPFICDRPFAYFIYDYFSSEIIFMGTFRNPSKL